MSALFHPYLCRQHSGRHGDCDAVGLSIANGRVSTYAVDVAFHEAGLNYGSKETTICKIIAKSVRTAMCLYGYFDAKDAEIVFASPKIYPAVLNGVAPCVDDLNTLLREKGFKGEVRIIANDEFNSEVLDPILAMSGGVADTSELFLRSYQMLQMFRAKDGQA